MKVYIEKDDVHKEMHFKGTMKELLKHLNINPAAVFVVRNGKILSEKEMLSDADDIRIREVFIGG